MSIKISKLNTLKYSSFFFYHLYQKLSLKIYLKNYKYFPDNIEHKKIIIEHSLVINNVNYFMKNSLIDKETVFYLTLK